MKSSLFILCIVSLLFVGCRETKETVNMEAPAEAAVQEPLTANHPELQVYMSKPGVRTGAIGVNFPITENRANWNRLSLGIEGRSYGTRIEFLDKLSTGDKYRITIYEPRLEADAQQSEEKIIFDEVLILNAQRNDLLEVEGVQFYTQS